MLWSDLYTQVARGAANAPNFILEEAIRDAAIELCNRTDVYKLEETVALSPDFDEYEVSPPTGYEVAHYLDLTLLSSNAKLQPSSFEQMRAEQRRISAGTPTVFASIDNSFFAVGPKPPAAENLAVIFSVKPTRAATEIPDTIGLEYRDALVYGALARLLGQADVPWRDSAKASEQGMLFRRELHRIARTVKYGFGGASLRVYDRPFC